MKYKFFLLFLVFGVNLNGIQGQGPSLFFTENAGQWEKQVLFKASLDGGSLFIESNGLTFSFYDKKKYRELRHGGFFKEGKEDFEIKNHAYKIYFENCNPEVEIVKSGEGSFYENFFLGIDKNKWKGHVKNYSQVFLKEIYDGIDYEITSQSDHPKYNFHVKPGADPGLIQISYEGVDGIKTREGSLIIELSVNKITEERPYAYQIVNGKEVKIECNYILSDSRLSFALPKGYNKDYELIIDPLLVFAAQSGSTSDNFGMTATYDSYGNFYSGGTTNANGYPTTTGAFSTSFTGTNAAFNDVVISKYNANGTNLLYSTYIGGSQSEVISSMIVDGNDNLCFYGTTGSADFPMLGSSYDGSFNGGSAINFIYNGTSFANGTDIYVAKLNSSGSVLLGSTFLGGSDNDGLNHVNHLSYIPNTTILEYNADSLQFNYGDQYRGEIQVDPFSNVYITSSTRSPDFPVVNAYDNSLGGKQDAIVAKFNSDLTQLIYSTYLGGNKNDCGNSLVVNTQSEVFVTGGTCSSDFPSSPGANNTIYTGGKADGFITHLSVSGNQLLHSTFVGTSSYDQSYFVRLGKSNDVYVFGQSLGNMPVVNSGTTVPYNNPGRHQFITRYSGDLSTKKMSTAFGSSLTKVDISPSAFGLDKCNNMYISGWGGDIINISSPGMSGMPLSFPTQSVTDGHDFYLMTLDSSAATLLYGSYFGGNISDEHVDGGTSRIDENGTFYQAVCAGCGGNDDFPVTTGAWPNTPGNPNHSSNCNNGSLKISSQIFLTSSRFISNANAGCAPLTISLTSNSSNYSNYVWYLMPGLTNSVSTNPVVTFTAPGAYTVSLVVNNPLSCNKRDSSVAFIHVISGPTVFVSSSGDTLCAGRSNTLLATGAVSYSWSQGATGSVAIVNPTVSTIYTVTATGLGVCPTNATIALVVQANPSVQISTSNALLCVGESSTLTANGAAFYNWNTGASTSTVAVMPTTTGIFSVTGTDLNGCQAAATITQLVDDCTYMKTYTEESSDIRVYPNPAKEELAIYAKNLIISLSLFNTIDEVLLERKEINSYDARLNVQSIKPGLYILEVNFADKNFCSRKVLKVE